MSIHPVALENTVAPIEFPALSTTAYTIYETNEVRITEDGETRITEDGETRVLDAWDITLYPLVNVVELPNTVTPVELE